MSNGIKFTIKSEYNSLVNIINLPKCKGFYNHRRSDIKVRTEQGIQITIESNEIYICGDNDKITHIKRKGDKSFKLI